jgi:hypothetical protein
MHFLEKVKGNKAKEIEIDEECALFDEKICRLEENKNELLDMISNAEFCDQNELIRIWEQRKSADEFLKTSNETLHALELEKENMQKIANELQETLREKGNVTTENEEKVETKQLHDKLNYRAKTLNNSKITIKQLLDQRVTHTQEVSTFKLPKPRYLLC